MSIRSTRARLAPYGIVPMEVIRDKALNRTDLAVYAVISKFQGTNDNAYPSVRRIAEEAGIDVSNAHRAISKLIALGWVVVLQRGNRTKTNVYACVYPVQDVLAVEPTQVLAGQPTQVLAGQPTYKSSKRTKTREKRGDLLKRSERPPLTVWKEEYAKLYGFPPPARLCVKEAASLSRLRESFSDEQILNMTERLFFMSRNPCRDFSFYVKRGLSFSTVESATHVFKPMEKVSLDEIDDMETAWHKEQERANAKS